MRLADFDYDLPESLIAQRPPARRRDARLLVLGAGRDDREDSTVAALPALLRPNDLVVLNDTRVIPARLFGRKATGGAVEVLLERTVSATRALAHIRASKSPKPGMRIDIEPTGALDVLGREGELFVVEVADGSDLATVLAASGHMPLPPYIARGDEPTDAERYQTIYARQPGAVAAPTAGLHIDEAMLDELGARSIQIAAVTLHVGAGTFQPVRGDDVESHVMHAERVEVGAEACAAIARTRAAGGRVVAIGTTVCRALEAAAAAPPANVSAGHDSSTEQSLAPYAGDTRLFIRPGFRFRVVDALLTNFHLPRSTLLMLVSAFGGHERVMAAYAHAVAAGYRFFSYGDAMWLERGSERPGER